eukprot:evm.model.scf_886.1 EVM.evm.TU.scf_886.1   scf_886:3545-6156(-)
MPQCQPIKREQREGSPSGEGAQCPATPSTTAGSPTTQGTPMHVTPTTSGAAGGQGGDARMIAPEDAAEATERVNPREQLARSSKSHDELSVAVDKDAKRRERNRQAQRKFRLRQKGRIVLLEQESRALMAKIRQLEIKNGELNRENSILRSYVGFFVRPKYGGSSLLR